MHVAPKRLLALREAPALSQLQLAAASGLTHENSSQLERGKWLPYADVRRALARALWVNPERLRRRKTSARYAEGR
jgi:transcriptional regulator with XRE-family HTH domain